MTNADLRHRRILIAGGTGDVGVEIVASLLKAGAHVVALTRSRARAEGLPNDPGLSVVEGFPDTDESVAKLRREVDRLGPIDGSVASLGPWFHGPGIVDLPKAGWDHMVAASLTSHFMFARLAVPSLKPGGRHLMINGGAALGPAPHSGVVSIMARAQTMLAEVLAAENPSRSVHTLMLLSIIATRARPDPDPRWITAHAVGEECARLFTAEAIVAPHAVTTLPMSAAVKGSPT